MKLSILVLLSSLSLLFISPCSADTGPAAVIKNLKGSAVVANSLTESGTPLVRGAKVFSGAIIRTNEGAEVEIELPEHHVVTLGPAATTVRWTGGRLNSVLVTVFLGQTRHSITKLGSDASYRVVTPTTVVGVRGTQFTVEAGGNGASRTKVSEGEVGIGDDEAEKFLSPGDVDEVYLVGEPDERGDDNGDNWIAGQTVANSEEACAIEREAASRMNAVNRMTRTDFSEMASLAANVALYAARRRTNMSDAEEGIDLLTRGLRVFRRMSARTEEISAQRQLTRSLAARQGISDAASDTQYRQFSSITAEKSGSMENFISGLERLSKLIKVAQTLQAPLGILNHRLPW